MLGASDLLRAAAQFAPAVVARRARPVAVGFHGVVRQIVDARIEVNHHDIDSFVRIVREIREYFDVLPLSALGDVLAAPERHRRALFLTADDGYRNTLTVAGDILEELRLPWTLFVSTHHIDTGEPNPLFLARLFLTFAPAGRYVLPHLESPVELGGSRKSAAEGTLKTLKRLHGSTAGVTVRAMLDAMPEGMLAELMARFSSERFLNWEDVRSLASRGVFIGAHAHHHWPMHSAAAACEARISREILCREIGACTAFAYPFGSPAEISRETWRAVRDAGFQHAFTTLSASLDGGENPWLLPRYILRPRENSLPAVLAMLPLGNIRLARWQRSVGDRE